MCCVYPSTKKGYASLAFLPQLLPKEPDLEFVDSLIHASTPGGWYRLTLNVCPFCAGAGAEVRLPAYFSAILYARAAIRKG